ncbi:MAG: hypothetical protein IGS03_09220 [Candidatus Sericytochromatia bacterium]|nr:hypothetical protein [Candidatus Sericytochromatia bacterium]
MGNINMMVNGVDIRAQHLVKLDQGVTQEQAMAAAADNGLDEIMVYDPESGEAYMAYGQGMDFGGLDGYQSGDRVHATLDGKSVAIVPFVAKAAGGQSVQLLYDDEINTSADGAKAALQTTKNIGGAVLGMAKDNALEIAGAGITLGAFARMGGAKIAETGSQSFLSKAGTFVFGPAKGLTADAAKGFGKVAKWGAIIGAGAVVVGTAGTAIYGGTRSSNAGSIESLGTKVK